VTPQDFDYLRKFLRDRSGLVLAARSNIWPRAGCCLLHAAMA
jgi:hypothetical protein